MDYFSNLIIGLGIDTPISHGRVIYAINKVWNGVDYDIVLKIKIGANTFIDISKTMLTTICHTSLNNGGIYNNTVFRQFYEQEANNHPCHIHIVGTLLVKAGVASVIDNRSYRVYNNI